MRNGRAEKKNRQHAGGLTGRERAFDGLLAVLSGVALGFAVLRIAAHYGDVYPELWHDFVRNYYVIGLNVLPVVLVSVALWLIVGRVWLSSLLTAAVFVGASLGNYFKIFYRGDPFVAADLTILREVGNISSRYPIELAPWMISVIVRVAVLVLALLLFQILRRRRAAKREGETKRKRHLIVRAVLLAALVLLAVYVVYPLYNNWNAYSYTDLSDESTYLEKLNTTDQYVSHGFVFSFIRSVYFTIEHPVDGYSDELARDILGRYTDADIPADRKVDVIAIMFEAFADFSPYDTVRLNGDIDVYGVWHRLAEEGISGRLVTNVFAAGTINTERNFLTGFDTTLSNYYSESTSFVRYFSSQGYVTTGSHPGEDWFYNRSNINRWLGFDTYYFRQNRYNDFGYDGILPDSVYLEDIWAQYAERDRTKPYFSFNVTYQNHAPYSDTGSPETQFVDPACFAGGAGAAEYNILNNYLNGIYQTNIAIETFVEHARESEDPLILILFGDHKPWLGGGNSVYEALNINIDLDTEEGMMNYYSSNYVIWANDAAKEVLGKGLTEEQRAERFSGDGGDSAPFFLMAKTFDMAGWEGPAFLQLEREFIRDAAVAVNRETEFYVLADGSFAKDPGEEVLAREREILYCQYYLKHKIIYAR